MRDAQLLHGLILMIGYVIGYFGGRHVERQNAARRRRTATATRYHHTTKETNR